MRTEKQAEASRINGAKSQGPVTEEGKDISKRNAIKTGMYSMGFVLPEHMETEVLDTIAWIYEKVNPDNLIEHKLTQSLAHHLVSFTEAVQKQIFHKLKISQRTLLCWDDDRKLAAAQVAEDITKRPVEISLQLHNSKHGCVFLLDIWDQLGAVLEAVGDWTDPQKALAYDLLGTHPALRGPGGRLHVPEGADAKVHLQAVIAAETARLIERRDGDLHDIDEADREQALLGNLPDDPIMQTYKRGETRSLNGALKIIKTMEVSLGRVGLAARLNFPRRAKCETKSEFNDRVRQHQADKKRAEEQDRILANAKRLREVAEAEEAERNAHPGFEAGMSLDAYIEKVREWHRRIYGVDHPMAVPPSLQAKMTDALPQAETPVERPAQPEQADTSTPPPPTRKPASKRRKRQKE